jgi:glycosyltransferase involved in cell wall biosynthesis
MTRSNNIFFNIIIPTKNRKETLKYTLKSIEAQAYDNYKIIILDNNSSDGTGDFIKRSNNRNIIYENSNIDLPMNINWERGLKFCIKGYVCVVGDDDGFFPDSFKKMSDFIKEKKTEIVSWHANVYYWYNVDSEKKNDIELYFSKSNNLYTKHSSHQTLKRILDMSIIYLEGPMIYNSFIDINLINKIRLKKKDNIFFSNGIPDVYSALVLLLNTKFFYKINFPVGLSGISKSSIGALISKKNKSVEDIIANAKYFNITTVPPIPSYYLSMLEPFNQLCKEFENACCYSVNFYRLKMRVKLEIESESKKNFDFYNRELNQFINKLKKQYSSYKKFIIFFNLFKITFYPTTERLILKLDKNITNIYDASIVIKKKYEFYSKNKLAKFKIIDKKLLLSNFCKKIGIYDILLTTIRAFKIFI